MQKVYQTYNILEDQQLIEQGIMPDIQKAFTGEFVTTCPISYDPMQTDLDYVGPIQITQASMYPVKEQDGTIREVVVIHENITERVQAEKEMAHNHQMLVALSQGAQEIQRARSIETVYLAIMEVAASMKLDAILFLLSEDKKHLIVSKMTLKSKLVRAAEKLTGLSAQGYQIPIKPGGFFDTIIQERKTVYSHYEITPFTEVLPKSLHWLSDKLADLLQWDQSINAPLTAGEKVIGVLTFVSSDLNQSDQTAISIFANQVAIAIENIQLYEQVINDANQLEKRIQDRTKQYQAIIDMTADREIRMRELKGVIKALRSQLAAAGLEPVADDPLAADM
jgi:transcriptional regulator with GAF, ATPase, and Fis domain